MFLVDSAACVAALDAESGPVVSSSTGSVPSFAQIYTRYFDFVWACTRRLGVSEAELDDVVQEIFVVVHSRIHTLEQPSSLRSWIYGIIKRTASNYHRSKRAQGAATLSPPPDIDYPLQPSPQELAEQSDHVKLLWELLDSLEPPKREVFVLAELDEMTAPEISMAIDVPLNTVYSRLRAARQEIEEALVRHNARTRGR